MHEQTKRKEKRLVATIFTLTIRFFLAMNMKCTKQCLLMQSSGLTSFPSGHPNLHNKTSYCTLITGFCISLNHLNGFICLSRHHPSHFTAISFRIIFHIRFSLQFMSSLYFIHALGKKVNASLWEF